MIKLLIFAHHMNVLDGLNNLKKYKETGKSEYRIDAEVNFSK